MEQSERVIAHFLYRSVPGARRHSASLMLVARLAGSNVVARVHPLGRGEGAQRSPARALSVIGPWRTTRSRRYAKARVAP